MSKQKAPPQAGGPNCHRMSVKTILKYKNVYRHFHKGFKFTMLFFHVEVAMEEEAQVVPKNEESPEAQETSITEQMETAVGGITNPRRTL